MESDALEVGLMPSLAALVTTLVLGVGVVIPDSALAAPKPDAQDLYQAGQQAYDRGDFAMAIAKWRASYELSGKAGLLFNLAQAYRLHGDCSNALVTYRKFIAIDPASPQRSLAEDLVRELEPTCVAASPPADRGRERNFKLAGLAIGGAGVVSLVVGLGFGYRASSLGDEVSRACSVSCDWADYKGKDADGRRAATLGYTLDVIGLVAMVGGATLYYLGTRESRFQARTSRTEVVVSWGRSW